MGRLTPKDWENQSNEIWLKLGYIQMSDEPFRTFLSESLQKLAHYEDLEEQGRLIELPCAINTELYFVGEKADGTYGVYSTTLFTLDLCKSYEGKIGKGFYLTKEEAEAKLEELKGE